MRYHRGYRHNRYRLINQFNPIPWESGRGTYPQPVCLKGVTERPPLHPGIWVFPSWPIFREPAFQRPSLSAAGFSAAGFSAADFSGVSASVAIAFNF